MKIKMILPAVSVADAVAMRDRIKGLILEKGEDCFMTDGGVAIVTENPARVSLELMAEGFID
jgi:hypothetical protein